MLCPTCHAPEERRVSQSIQNLGREYIRVSICQRFLRWAQSNRREVKEEEESTPRLAIMLNASNMHDILVELREIRMLIKMLEKNLSLIIIFRIVIVLMLGHQLLKN